MGLAEDAEIIKEYIQWKASRMDQSPEAFVLDRAKSGAYDRLEAAMSFLVDTSGDDEEIGSSDLTANGVKLLYKILAGN